MAKRSFFCFGFKMAGVIQRRIRNSKAYGLRSGLREKERRKIRVYAAALVDN